MFVKFPLCLDLLRGLQAGIVLTLPLNKALHHVKPPWNPNLYDNLQKT